MPRNRYVSSIIDCVGALIERTNENDFIGASDNYTLSCTVIPQNPGRGGNVARAHTETSASAKETRKTPPTVGARALTETSANAPAGGLFGDGDGGGGNLEGPSAGGGGGATIPFKDLRPFDKVEGMRLEKLLQEPGLTKKKPQVSYYFAWRIFFTELSLFAAHQRDSLFSD